MSQEIPCTPGLEWLYAEGGGWRLEPSIAVIDPSRPRPKTREGLDGTAKGQAGGAGKSEPKKFMAAGNHSTVSTRIGTGSARELREKAWRAHDGGSMARIPAAPNRQHRQHQQ